MAARIRDFNAGTGGQLVALKVGVHTGACLAVTLNDRLDYFGQTVNIAARIQALAGAGEIVVSDDVLAAPGAEAAIDGLERERFEAELRGVEGAFPLNRLRLPG
jgi:class 3 adenylate cyclase